MKKFFVLMMLACLLLIGCEKKQPLVYNVNKSAELREYESEVEAESAFEEEKIRQSIAAEESRAAEEASAHPAAWSKRQNGKERTRVRGIYLTDATAGSDRMESIIGHIDETELNAVVIDIKNDEGRIAYRMNAETVQALGAERDTITDIQSLLQRMKAHGIYAIARIVSFRDPYLETVKPEWMYRLPDGSVFHDSAGMAWVNPYQRAYWDYISEIISACAADGFDEVQLDYVRFCTERGMQDVVFPEEETQGRSKTEIITEFVRHISDRAAEAGIFLSTDVFGTIIGSYVDSHAVGQDYALLSEAVDYMCPMIYPSHYGDGNFGIAHPDTEPYRTILFALSASRKALEAEPESGQRATVRPWLQGFTASYLSNYIRYGPEQLRAQIQAVYDSGYEEWLVWNASNNYDWGAFPREENG